MNTKVEKWMTKNPLKIDIREDAENAWDIMEREKVHHLLVTDKGSLVGVLSHLDLQLVAKIRKKFTGLVAINQKVTVGDVMSRTPVEISCDLSMAEASRIMYERKCHALPVNDRFNRIKGILTSTDVTKFAFITGQKNENGWTDDGADKEVSNE